MRISKYIKANRDILLEYIYDDGNLISEPYKVLVNSKDRINSYLAGDSSGTGNIQSNQLFKIDAVSNKFAKVNTSYYSFLQTKDYSAGFPLRNDIIKIHLPINYTFGEFLGFYIRIYTFDYLNRTTFELSNFYFDMTDISQQYLLNYTSPPFLFQEKLWGKNIKIEIPSVSEVSNQRLNGVPKEDSVNANLTDGLGLSLTSPIFIDFHFISKIDTVNGITNYFLTSKTPISIPQTPEFEKLGLKIEESVNGDFFEIFGTYNDTIGEFKQFIDNAVTLGNRYYAEFTVTLYEQNIKGKSLTISVMNNFNEKIEYRPIIKYSTTTAIIDVEMRIIDAVDNSYIVRRASYGMLQDQVSKYSLSLTKINLRNSSKPKIYALRPTAEMSGLNDISSNSTNITLQPVKIPFPVMSDKFNIVAKSSNVIFGKEKFFGTGKLLINIFPFDNIINFIIANDFSENESGEVITPHYLDMTNLGDIKFVVKNTTLSAEFPIYREADNNLSIGQVVFKITKNKIPDIKKIYEMGNNVFYIVSTNQDITTVIYSGLFKMYDSLNNINDLNNNIPTLTLAEAAPKPSIIDDPDTKREKAIVTRKIIGKSPLSAKKSISPIKIGGIGTKSK